MQWVKVHCRREIFILADITSQSYELVGNKEYGLKYKIHHTTANKQLGVPRINL